MKNKLARLEWEKAIKDTLLAFVALVGLGETIRGNTPLTGLSAALIYITLLWFLVDATFANYSTGLVQQENQERRKTLQNRIAQWAYTISQIKRNYIYAAAFSLTLPYIIWLLFSGLNACQSKIFEENSILLCLIK
jgi:hypothetical protein